jgi:hypothetical protein
MRRITTNGLRPRRALTQPLAVLLTALCLTLLTFIATASAGSARPFATTSRVALRTAVTARATADRTLASRRKTLKRCLRKHPRGCRAARRAVRRAVRELTKADLKIVKAARHHGGTRRAGGHRAPTSITSLGPIAPTGPAPKSPAPAGSGSGPASASGSKGTIGSGNTNGSAGAFEMGAVVGSAPLYELPWLERLGAHTARIEFAIDTPVSQLEPVIDGYARAGIRPLLLAGFQGRLPSAAEAQNLASWAAAFGPGGTFWQGKSYPASTAVSSIEFGNETSYSYQFSDTASNSAWYALSSYAARAQAYALRFRDAETAIQSANPNVGLLAQADDGDSGSSTWVENMFAAVPNLAKLVAGWTVHPYGPSWEAEINRLIASTAAQGAPASIPIYATEWGLSSDNGRCVEENFGFNRCMTYGEAASTLDSSVAAMHAKYGSRLRGLYIFQARDQQASGAATGREGYCGALQSDQASKGAYTTAVQALLAANP